MILPKPEIELWFLFLSIKTDETINFQIQSRQTQR